MNRIRAFLIIATLLVVAMETYLSIPPSLPKLPERWSPEQAWAWKKKTGWLVGPNYLPSNAINQLEMWQAETWSPALIDKELGWAHGLGFNCIRVFLHDLAWKQDPAGFLQRMDQFLEICHKHEIRVIFVIFDGVWNPFPHIGLQPTPVPGLHNSGWVQSPGKLILEDHVQFLGLADYVKAVVGRFKDDPRVVMWDVWNEPNNMNLGQYALEENPDKEAIVRELLPIAFQWIRDIHPSQPLTVAIWQDQSQGAANSDLFNYICLGLSDVISYHGYLPPASQQEVITALKKEGRPLVCTEYMARPAGSTFQNSLPLFKQNDVDAFNWGFVAGKSQTIYAWDTWSHPASGEPKVWFHDVLQTNGTPYSSEEADFLRSTLQN